MDTDVAHRPAGPLRFLRAVLPAIRVDAAARRAVAVGLALRLAITAGGFVLTAWGLGEDPGTPAVAVVTGVFTVAWLSVAGFTKVALLAALDARERGAPITARQAFARAWARRRAIAGWVVGVRRYFDWWEPEVAFALPALATGDAADRADAERRSVAAHRARWAFADVEAGTPTAIAVVLGGLAFGLACLALAFHGIVAAVGVAASLVLLQVALTAGALLRGVLALAIYRDEVHGAPPFGLTSGELAQLAVAKTDAAGADLRETAPSATLPDHGHGSS